VLPSLRAQGSEFQRRHAERIDQDPDLALAYGIVLAELRRAMDQRSTGLAAAVLTRS
jgi:hypothetical protein